MVAWAARDSGGGGCSRRLTRAVISHSVALPLAAAEPMAARAPSGAQLVPALRTGAAPWPVPGRGVAPWRLQAAGPEGAQRVVVRHHLDQQRDRAVRLGDDPRPGEGPPQRGEGNQHEVVAGTDMGALVRQHGG